MVILISSDHEELLAHERPDRERAGLGTAPSSPPAAGELSQTDLVRAADDAQHQEHRMRVRLEPQLAGPLAALVLVTAIVALTSDRFLDPAISPI